jgi:hypothetical protein
MPGQSQFLNLAILIIACLLSLACKKERQIFRGKEVKATIILSSGSTVEINTSPGNAYIGCGILYVSAQGPSFIQGINDAYTAAIILSVGDTCIVHAGTYKFTCQYVKDYSGQSITYQNDSVADPGTLTYTVVKDDYVEGTFHAVCKYDMDSVQVNGTFKGYMN